MTPYLEMKCIAVRRIIFLSLKGKGVKYIIYVVHKKREFKRKKYAWFIFHIVLGKYKLFCWQKLALHITL